MGNILFPRHGSMQFWPRKRAKRIYARVRAHPQIKDVKVIGFAGYKVRMSQAIVLDNSPHSMTKNEEIILPVTILEVPPMRIASVRFYKKTVDGLRVADELFIGKYKELDRKIYLPEKQSRKLDDFKDKLTQYHDIKVIVHTQPKLAGVSKKKPEMFEMNIGGSSIEDKYNYVVSNIDKDIRVSTIFSEGDFIDVHAVTKGHGFQGPVKRFGVALKPHKSQKGQRGVGSLGPWSGQAHFMYRIAHAGQMGFHQRTEYNKMILKIGNAKEFNRKGGFEHYGILKNDVLIITGSIPGPSKRLIRIVPSMRKQKKKISFQFLKLINKH